MPVISPSSTSHASQTATANLGSKGRLRVSEIGHPGALLEEITPLPSRRAGRNDSCPILNHPPPRRKVRDGRPRVSRRRRPCPAGAERRDWKVPLSSRPLPHPLSCQEPMRTLIDGYNVMYALGLLEKRVGPERFRKARARFL